MVPGSLNDLESFSIFFTQVYYLLMLAEKSIWAWQA